MYFFRIVLVLIFGFAGCKRNPAENGAFEVRPVSSAPEVRLRKYWQIPDFDLIDQQGEAFARSMLNGKVWVVDFFYSSCPGPCPMLSSRLSEIHRKYTGEERVGFLSVSSDPEKDTPDVLLAYSKKFGADKRWRFLTGQKSAVYRLAIEGFKLSLQEVVGAAEPITHSTRLALVDTDGWVRGFYEGVGEDSAGASQRLIDDIRELLKGAL